MGVNRNTGVYKAYTGVYIGIQGFTGVYRGEHRNREVYRSIHGCK